MLTRITCVHGEKGKVPRMLQLGWGQREGMCTPSTVESRKPPICTVYKENSTQNLPGMFSFLSAFTLFSATFFSYL